jgi:hypothetical protein
MHTTHVALLAFCVGAGYAVGGAFPCDPGLPRHGSWRQNIHDMGGLLEYVGGAYAIYRLLPLTGLCSVIRREHAGRRAKLRTHVG